MNPDPNRGKLTSGLSSGSDNPNKIRCLIDSGSQTSALSRTVADRLKLWPIVDRSFARSLGGIAGSVTNGSYGRLHYTRLLLPTSAGGGAKEKFDCAWEVLDLPGYDGNVFEGILGLDFLMKGVIDLNRMHLEIVNPKTNARAQLPLISQKDGG